MIKRYLFTPLTINQIREYVKIFAKCDKFITVPQEDKEAMENEEVEEKVEEKNDDQHSDAPQSELSATSDLEINHHNDEDEEEEEGDEEGEEDN
jgi:hypothetical protein